MVTKKDLVIVALATFCLTVSLFMILPTKSNPEGYDAWNDLNDDGRIDIFDAIRFADTFNTAGDPTKNVNVTNFPLDDQGNIKVNIPKAQMRYVDCIDYTILDISYCTDGALDRGARLDPRYGESVEGFFCFNPKGTLLNVTRIGVAAVIPNLSRRERRMDITINNGTAKVYPTSSYGGPPWVAQMCVEAGDLVQYVVQGLNKLTISHTEFWNVDRWDWEEIEYYRITVFVEYEYLA